MEDFFSGMAVSQLILLGILSGSFLVQIIYYLLIYIRVPLFKPNEQHYSETKNPVSIIICARNEAENLTLNLPLILEQDYPDFEVIVVNDCSDDETQNLLEKFQEKYKHLRLTRIKHDEKFTHGKKLALTIGIKAAKNDWLLLTDADCIPNGKNWLSSMQRNFTPANDIVLGYSGFVPVKGFLNKLIRFDCMLIALQYISFALIKVPYMGVGRNLAYRKSLFMKNKGFASHAHMLSGDDDLFINEVATGKNTNVEISIEAHTLSLPKKTFNHWLIQKKRHLSTGNRYKFIHKFLLGFEIFSRLLFYCSIVLLLLTPGTWLFVVVAYVMRLIVQLIIIKQAMNKFNEKNIWLYSIIFDFVLPLINLFLYLTNAFNPKQHKWK